MSSHPQKPPRATPLTPVAVAAAPAPPPAPKEPLWRDVVGDVLRRERRAQQRTLKEVAEAARISMPYLSELERGRKEASSEVLAAAARALGLGLADLLALGQDEVLRISSARSAVRRSAASISASISTPVSASISAPVSRQGEVRLAA